MASITTANRNRAADAVCVRANGGTLRIYSGGMPADANAPLSGNSLLASLGFPATAFSAAVNGVAVANAISPDTSADATGTASFFRVLESDGSTVVFQGTVGMAAAELNLTSTAIVAGGPVSVSSLSYMQAGS
jgi:hypothetical protein